MPPVGRHWPSDDDENDVQAVSKVDLPQVGVEGETAEGDGTPVGNAELHIRDCRQGLERSHRFFFKWELERQNDFYVKEKYGLSYKLNRNLPLMFPTHL